MKIRLIALVTICLLSGGLIAQDSDQKESDKTADFTEGPGIKVGAELPEITLKNQNGEDVAVRELAKSKNVALVFYRSADW